MKYKSGAVNIFMVLTIVFIVLFMGAGAVAVWSYVNYIDQRDNVNSMIDEAVASARREEAQIQEEKFAEREKEPNRDFVAPEAYGSLTFKYPKTWSVYEASVGGSNSDYRAFLNPIIVPSTDDSTSLFALRVRGITGDLESVLSEYSGYIEEGTLTSTALSTIGQTSATGVRLDGQISSDIRGSIVIFRIRDKTMVLQSDAEAFRPDFDALLQTINFNA